MVQTDVDIIMIMWTFCVGRQTFLLVCVKEQQEWWRWWW